MPAMGRDMGSHSRTTEISISEKAKPTSSPTREPPTPSHRLCCKYRLRTRLAAMPQLFNRATCWVCPAAKWWLAKASAIPANTTPMLPANNKKRRPSSMASATLAWASSGVIRRSWTSSLLFTHSLYSAKLFATLDPSAAAKPSAIKYL